MNVLYIDHVEVCDRKDGSNAFGFIVFDNFECENVLGFDAEADVPQTIRCIVEHCREEYCDNALDALERCAEEGHSALLNGVPVDRAELATILAETRDD